MMQNNIFSRAKYDDERNKYGQLLAVGIVISLQFHSNSEKYKLFKSGPKSLDLIDFEANLAKDKKCLKEHLFFVHLKKNHQDRALSGKHATYMTRRELIARLPFSTDELNWIYRHVSNEVHTTAFAFSSQSRERGRGDENLAERAYTINAIWLVRKYLAAAILGMKQMFPKEIGGGKAMEVQIAKEHFDDAM